MNDVTARYGETVSLPTGRHRQENRDSWRYTRECSVSRTGRFVT